MTSKVFADYAEKPNKLCGAACGDQLSIRESEVLRYTALGYSNKEIAHKMDISVKTIEAHKTNGLKKLDIKSRKEIVGYAILRGWMREN